MNLSKKFLSVFFLFSTLSTFGIEYKFPAYTYKGFFPFIQAGLGVEGSYKQNSHRAFSSCLFLTSGIYNKISANSYLKIYAFTAQSAFGYDVVNDRKYTGYIAAYGLGLQAKIKQIEAQIEVLPQTVSAPLNGIIAIGSVALTLPTIKQLSINKRPVETAVGIEVTKCLGEDNSFSSGAFVRAKINPHLSFECGVDDGVPYAGVRLF